MARLWRICLAKSVGTGSLDSNESIGSGATGDLSLVGTAALELDSTEAEEPIAPGIRAGELFALQL